jgi:hypothetical protein
MIHDKLKKIIFNKLYKDLSKAEIIDFNDSIWFIDRDNKYWYFEYEKVGRLYWRYDFFPNFFSVFSLERNEFEPIMSEWIEEVLNCKVNAKSSEEALHIAESRFYEGQESEDNGLLDAVVTGTEVKLDKEFFNRITNNLLGEQNA